MSEEQEVKVEEKKVIEKKEGQPSKEVEVLKFTGLKSEEEARKFMREMEERFANISKEISEMVSALTKRTFNKFFEETWRAFTEPKELPELPEKTELEKKVEELEAKLKKLEEKKE